MASLDLGTHSSIPIAYNLFTVFIFFFFLLCVSSLSNPLSPFSFTFLKEKKKSLEKD